MEKIKVLFIGNKVPFPDLDGGTAASRAMIQNILDAGCTVQAVFFDTEKHPVRSEALFPEWHDPAFSLEKIRVDTRVNLRDALLNLLFSTKSYHIIRVQKSVVQKQLQAITEKFLPDIILLDGLFALAQAPFLKSVTRAPLVYRAHNIESEIWFRLAGHSRFNPKKRYLRILAKRLQKFEKKTAHLLRDVWAVSEPVAQFFAALKVPARVVYPSFRLQSYEAPHEQYTGRGPFRMFHVGAMDWQPNTEAVAFFVKEIFPQLRRQFPLVEFHAGGRHFDVDAFPETEGVFYYGEIEDYRAFTADKHALVVPLLSGSGIRMKIPEAWAAGIPVLATPAAIRGIPAEPGVHFGMFSNTTELLTLCRTYLESPEYWQKLSQNGRRQVEALFSHEALAKSVGEYIADIVRLDKK